MPYAWTTAPTSTEEFKQAFAEFDPVVLQLLQNRKLTTQKAIDAFFQPSYEQDLYDPFLFRDMEKAVKRIFTAVVNKEPIVVYGDYDADGVCSTVLLANCLRRFGAELDIYIPFRETEGYGMNLPAVTKLAEQGVKLVITVDNGIANFAEVAFLQDRGIDVIITDHHKEPLRLPSAFATINPNVKAETYPFRDLCGSGVAFKLVSALLERQSEYSVPRQEPGAEKWLLDLAALGTVADMMPLLDENRALVHYGLRVLRQTRNLGIRKLLEISNTPLEEVTERTIGFQLGPRINAAGRLNHASVAYELLTTNDPAKASALATELEATNRERQRLTEEITKTVLEQIGSPEDQQLLVAVGQGWPTGLVGLVAGKIADRFYKPTLVISDFKGQLIGSGRSIADFDITAALQQCDSLLARYGGHAQACGFTLKSAAELEPFIQNMRQVATEVLAGKELKPTIKIDVEVKMSTLDWDLYAKLEAFAPFGTGNPKPVFAARNLEVARVQTMGKDNSHLRLLLAESGQTYKFIAFGKGDLTQELHVGQAIDVAFDVDVNEWNGNRELQFKLIDYKNSKL